MNQNYIFFPCLGLLVLTVVVLLRMVLTRVSAVKNGTVDVRFFKTYNLPGNLPNHMAQASRNFTNLFEVPTLFYMVCVFALITRNVDSLMYIAAWFYVGLRCLHSLIHLTSNKIVPRMSVYIASWLVLGFMGLLLAYKIL
ncbi:MAG: MAPEG family protein [Bacteriovorax sp.]|nr:MAPEG family protein [Bacteriovorax sp.]